jgi:hypothetical protein
LEKERAEFLVQAFAAPAGGRVGIFAKGGKELDVRAFARGDLDKPAGAADSDEELGDTFERGDGGGKTDAKKSEG